MRLSFTVSLYLHVCFVRPRVQTPEPPNGYSWNLILGVSLKFVETYPFWLTSSNNNEQSTRRPTRISAHIWIVTRKIFTGAKNVSSIGYRENWNTFYAHYSVDLYDHSSIRLHGHRDNFTFTYPSSTPKSPKWSPPFSLSDQNAVCPFNPPPTLIPFSCVWLR